MGKFERIHTNVHDRRLFSADMQLYGVKEDVCYLRAPSADPHTQVRARPAREDTGRVHGTFAGFYRDLPPPPRKIHPFIGEEKEQKNIFLTFSGSDVARQKRAFTANMLAATEGDPLVNIHINVSHIKKNSYTFIIFNF